MVAKFMGLESRPGLIRVAALVTTPVDGRRDVVVGLTCGDGVVRVAFFRRECGRQAEPAHRNARAADVCF